MDTVISILRAILFVVIAYAVVFVAALVNIYFERRAMAFIGDRLGPNRTGPQGVLQSVADAFKMMGKEDFRPLLADPVLFTLAPVMVMIGAVAVQLVLPYTGGLMATDLNIGVIFLVAITSFTTLSILMGGWASRNKYSLVGALRAAAQMISYEIPMLLGLLIVAMIVGSLRISTIVAFQAALRVDRLLRAVHVPHLLHRVDRRAEPRPVRPARVRVGARRRLRHRVLGHALRHVLPQRVRRPHHHVHGRRHAVLRRLDGAAAPAPSTSGASTGSASSGSSPRRTSWSSMLVWIRFSIPRLQVDQLMAFAWKILIPLGLVNILATAAIILWVPSWKWGLAVVRLGLVLRLRGPLRPDPQAPPAQAA